MAYFFQHMKSPIGRNAQCWSNFVGHSFHKMPVVNKKFMFQRLYDSLPTSVFERGSVLRELCIVDIAPRLCLSWTKWILLYNFYACSNVYFVFLHFIIVYLCTTFILNK